MNFNELLKKDKDKELDWDVEKVIEVIPEIAKAKDDDEEQRFLNSAMTPYIASNFQTSLHTLNDDLDFVEKSLNLKILKLEKDLERESKYWAYSVLMLTIFYILLIVGLFYRGVL